MKILALLLLLMSLSSLVEAIDVACPEDSPKNVKSDGVRVEKHENGGKQKIVNIFLPRKYDGFQLYNVSLRFGDWKYDSNGNLISAPIISASLEIREFQGSPMVQVIVGKPRQNINLSIQYGEFCGVVMEHVI